MLTISTIFFYLNETLKKGIKTTKKYCLIKLEKTEDNNCTKGKKNKNEKKY